MQISFIELAATHQPGHGAVGALVLAPLEVEEWIEQLIEEFATGME